MDHIENHVSPNCIVDGMSVSEHVKAKRCLVEKLGGYSEAKDILKVRIRAGFIDSVDELEKALLEYRREHGIFEVGDWVGIKDDSTNWVDKVVSIEYKKIHDSKWNASVTEILVFKDGSRLGVGWAIHATDEEIKAGHRL